MVYQVGNPAMLEGNRFFPETGMPIWKMLRNSTVLADCEPDPFTVATWMLKSLITGCLPVASVPWCSMLAVAIQIFCLFFCPWKSEILVEKSGAARILILL